MFTITPEAEQNTNPAEYQGRKLPPAIEARIYRDGVFIGWLCDYVDYDEQAVLVCSAPDGREIGRLTVPK